MGKTPTNGWHAEKSILEYAQEGWRSSKNAAPPQSAAAGFYNALAWRAGSTLRKAGLGCPTSFSMSHAPDANGDPEFGLAVRRENQRTVLAVFSADGEILRVERIWRPYRETPLDMFALYFPR